MPIAIRDRTPTSLESLIFIVFIATNWYNFHLLFSIILRHLLEQSLPFAPAVLQTNLRQVGAFWLFVLVFVGTFRLFFSLFFSHCIQVFLLENISELVFRRISSNLLTLADIDVFDCKDLLFSLCRSQLKDWREMLATSLQLALGCKGELSSIGYDAKSFFSDT